MKFCENNAKKRQLLTKNTMVMCCEKKIARTWSSMTRQLYDANDVHQLLKRTVVVFIINKSIFFSSLVQQSPALIECLMKTRILLKEICTNLCNFLIAFRRRRTHTICVF